MTAGSVPLRQFLATHAWLVNGLQLAHDEAARSSLGFLPVLASEMCAAAYKYDLSPALIEAWQEANP